MRRFNWRK